MAATIEISLTGLAAILAGQKAVAAGWEKVGKAQAKAMGSGEAGQINVTVATEGLPAASGVIISKEDPQTRRPVRGLFFVRFYGITPSISNA